MKRRDFLATTLIGGAVGALTGSLRTTFGADDPMVPPEIITPPTAQYAAEVRGFQGVSSICASGNDRLWCAWYAGGNGEQDQNYVLLATSGDRGETWSEPIMAIDPSGRTRAFDQILWTDPNGAVWLFWSQSEFIPYNTEERRDLEARGLSTSAAWDGRAGLWAIRCDEPEKGPDAR